MIIHGYFIFYYCSLIKRFIDDYNRWFTFEDLLLNKKEEKEKEKDIMKRGYTLSDDEHILGLVKKFESEKIEPSWEYIGTTMNRTGRQVKYHYDHLMSNVQVVWTAYEIQVALMIEFIYGRNFKLLNERIPNKSWYHIIQ